MNSALNYISKIRNRTLERFKKICLLCQKWTNFVKLIKSIQRGQLFLSQEIFYLNPIKN